MNRSLTNQTVAMTGCTGGLGRALCFQLAQLGAILIMVDRNPQKSAALAGELRAAYPGLQITSVTADLEDMDSVRAAAERLRTLTPNVLLLNAGAYNIPRKLCNSGFDSIFQINFAASYCLVRELTGDTPELRVVAVGSVAHRYSPIDPADPDFRTRKGVALPYGNAKRLLMLALHEWFRDRPNHLAIVHPGLTVTNITNHYPPALYFFMKQVMKVIFMKPEQAARSILEGVFTPTPYGAWIGPRFFGIWGGPRVQRLGACAVDGTAAGEIAENLYTDFCKKT